MKNYNWFRTTDSKLCGLGVKINGIQLGVQITLSLAPTQTFTTGHMPRSQKVPLLDVSFGVDRGIDILGLLITGGGSPADIGKGVPSSGLVVLESQLSRLCIINIDHALFCGSRDIGVVLIEFG